MTIFFIKVDFGDFKFLRIEPKVVRYVSGVATAVLGSGGLCVAEDLFCFMLFHFKPMFIALLLIRQIQSKEYRSYSFFSLFS